MRDAYVSTALGIVHCSSFNSVPRLVHFPCRRCLFFSLLLSTPSVDFLPAFVLECAFAQSARRRRRVRSVCDPTLVTPQMRCSTLSNPRASPTNSRTSRHGLARRTHTPHMALTRPRRPRASPSTQTGTSPPISSTCNPCIILRTPSHIIPRLPRTETSVSAYIQGPQVSRRAPPKPLPPPPTHRTGKHSSTNAKYDFPSFFYFA
jgi:hypothetical protein